MKQILVASDLSHRSDLAVAQALFLARRFGASLIVLHVVDDELPVALFTATREQAAANLRETVDRLSGDSGARSDVRVVGGLDFQAIVETAEAEDASLIILGAHRRNILKDVFTGTTVERVIRNTARPVLVVRRPEPGVYVCTLAAVDLVEEADAVVRWAHRLAQGQTLYLMHVLSDVTLLQMKAADTGGSAFEEHRQSMDERCRALLHELAARAELRKGDYLPAVGWGAAVPQLLEAAQTFPVNLGVVGTQTHVKGAVERFLLGSVAEELLRDMPCDVLAVPLSGASDLPGAGTVTILEPGKR